MTVCYVLFDPAARILALRRGDLRDFSCSDGVEGWDVKHSPTFRRNAVPPSSGSTGPRIAVRKKYVHCTRPFRTAVPYGS